MVAGLAGLASAARSAMPEAQSPRRSRRGLAAVGAYLADGYVLAAALFLIGWVTLFGAAYARSDDRPVLCRWSWFTRWWTCWSCCAALPLAQTAGRRAVAPYLALVAVTVGDALAVGARIAGTQPGHRRGGRAARRAGPAGPHPVGESAPGRPGPGGSAGRVR